jgi:4-oxalmesaconate hydratase
MIIDCHGHYTTAPAETAAWCKVQVQALGNPSQAPSKVSLSIYDDQIRETLEGAQLKLQRMRGTDLTFFSPRASAMVHSIGDARKSSV